MEPKINPKVTATSLSQLANSRPLAALTAWDYYSGTLAEESGADLVLVGDSLAMTIRGEDNTLSVTMDEMVYHAAQVSRACSRALVVGDMPFLSYQIDEKEAIRNAGRFLRDGGVGAVKIEGGVEMSPTISRICEIGIPVLGHVGLRPQQVHKSGYRVQGRTAAEADAVIADALAVERSGCFAVVLECLPTELARYITNTLGIPTLGIGAGPHCDGQIQVTADLLGMSPRRPPRHAKTYTDCFHQSSSALSRYVADVRGRRFPTDQHSFLGEDELSAHLKTLPGST